jgi:hypothetical protein
VYVQKKRSWSSSACCAGVVSFPTNVVGPLLAGSSGGRVAVVTEDRMIAVVVYRKEREVWVQSKRRAGVCALLLTPQNVRQGSRRGFLGVGHLSIRSAFGTGRVFRGHGILQTSSTFTDLAPS